MNRLMRIGFWGRLIQDFRLLYALIKDYWRGEYREVSIWSIIVFVFGIAYVLSPIDLIPDFVPFMGQIDDAAILIICMYLLERDLYKYRDWKMSRST